MAKETNIPTPMQQKRWIGGISDYLKESAVADAYYFGVSINYREDPQSITLLPGARLESGSTVTDLLKWGDIVPDTNLNSYYYGDAGNIYKRTNQGQWSLIHTAASSHGNGMSYFSADGYLYYSTDSTLGRYGQITTEYQFSENWSTNSFSSAWFNWGGNQVTVADNLLTITSTTGGGFYGVELAAAQNLTGYAVTNQLVDVGSRSLTSWEVYPVYVTIRGDSTNQLFWYITNTNALRATKKVAGSNTNVATGTYDPTVHKYFRIREEVGTIYWDYSTDSTNWTNFGSDTNPFAITNVTIGQQAGSTVEATTTAAVFDNFTFAPGNNAAQASDNFLRSQGGTPLNTYSLALLAAASQYATAADSASLSITGDLTLEAYVKLSSLPAVGSVMTFMGKWDESTNARSYKIDILGVSGYFGDGSDGALTISSNTTQAPVDASCSGAAGTNILLATNASFSSGDVIKIVQTQGTNAGQYERNTIQSYTTGQIITNTPLLGSYGVGAQVIVIPQYTTITVNNGVTWSAKAWNGTVGSELVALYSSTCTINGTISATGAGFRGGAGGLNDQGSPSFGYPGEGTPGVVTVRTSFLNNGNGGGGGNDFENQSGAGGGNGAPGQNGTRKNGTYPFIPLGGTVAGSNDLANMSPGGGGGGSGHGGGHGGVGATGGDGGGIIHLTGTTLSMGATGSMVSNGEAGTASFETASGGGAGGSILLEFQTGTLGTNQVQANGGAAATGTQRSSGAGGSGRIVVRYLTSVAGTTTPALVQIQDNSLVTTTTYQLRLGLSGNGTTAEFLTKNLPNLTTGTWNRFSISWQATSSTAIFYMNAQSLGAAIGTLTAIHDNASLFYLGADKASAVGNFVNGQIDDVRVWGNMQTAAQIAANNVTQLTGDEGGLNAYWMLNNAATDSTANANTLTLVNSPLYTTDVPFPDASTRLDIDQNQDIGGNTYALPISISEVTADMLDFTPTKDPQASVSFVVDDPGTGDWTVVVHDQQNREIATSTITNANLPSAGLVEFFFNPAWRIVLDKPYHMHLISTQNDGTIESGSANNINTATYTTYFQFLVTDTQFHPIVPFLNFMVVGNERYLATWDGAFYQPNLIAFPTGTKVRSLGFWREFLAIGVWRGNSITDFDQGKIYFWDGTAPTFNFFIDVPQGQIAALYGKDSDLYFFAGYRGVLMKYTGGGMYTNGNSAAVKLKRVPKIQPQDYVDIYPGSLTMWRDLVHFGVAANSSSNTVTRAVYSWGSLNQLYPETLSCDYPISTGNTLDTVSIGLTFPVGQSLIIGWRDGVATGADVINFSNPPASEGYIQTLVKDDDALWKDKLNFDVRADHLALEDGESVAVGISIDRGDFDVGGTTANTSLFTKMPVSSGRGREYQLSVYMYATGSTSPTVLGLGVLHSDTPSEQQW